MDVERLSGQVADLNRALEQEQQARSAAAREAKEKGEKLERLESECCMCHTLGEA